MEDTAEEVTCQDCVHNRGSWFSRTFKIAPWGWKCSLAVRQAEYQPATGMTEPESFNLCSFARAIEGVCGRKGKNWKPRSKKNMFIYLKRI